MVIRKRGFTLIELMIVIGIIVLLFGALMRFSFSRIQELTNQSQKEEFVTTYTHYTQQHLVSPYWGGKRYTSYRLSFLSGGSTLLVTFSGDTSSLSSGFVARKGYFSSGFSATFFPYRVGCELVVEKNVVDSVAFQLSFPLTHQKFCFELEHIPCILHTVACVLP